MRFFIFSKKKAQQSTMKEVKSFQNINCQYVCLHTQNIFFARSQTLFAMQHVRAIGTLLTLLKETIHF